MIIKRLFIILICLGNMSLFSQNMEVIGGINKNNFYNFNQQGHFVSSYTPGLGYTLKVGIEDVKVDWLKLRFTLGYDRCSGKLEASDGGLGGGYTTIAEVDKSLISVGVFPVNFKIINRIDLNFGFDISGLISETIEGTRSEWRIDEPYGSNYDLSDIYDRYSSLLYFGLKGRLAYDLRISDKLVISPQYSYYFGLSNEFDEFPEQTKSMKHYFCIGIQKRLRKDYIRE